MGVVTYVGWREVGMNLFNGWRCHKEKYRVKNVKETKEETIDEDFFCFSEAMCTIFCMLVGCDRSWSGGVKLGVLMCDGYNGMFFFYVWRNLAMMEAWHKGWFMETMKG